VQTTSPGIPARPPASRWLRVLLPSVSDLIFLALLFSLSCGVLAPRLLGDAGIGWHIRNGQQMLLTHAVTRSDPFSSTMGGKPWYAWEWLYDLLIAGIHHFAGLYGVVLFTAIVVALTFALVFRLTLARGGNLPLAVILLALSVGASAIHLFARPHVLSWLLAVSWFQLLDSWDANASRDSRLFWLPVLMLFWVNLHGGFLTGFILLGLYLTGGFIEYLGAREQDRPRIIAKLKHLAVITPLALLATFVNPYGFRLHGHIYQYLSDRFLMNHIQEFGSPNFHGAAERCFAALFLITILAVTTSRNKPRPSPLLVMLFAVASGLYASRNLPVSSLLLTLLVTPILSGNMAGSASSPEMATWVRRMFSRWTSFASRMESFEVNLRGHLWPAIAVVFGIAICVHGGRLGSRQIMAAHFPEKRFPVRAVDVIAQRGIHEPIFCPDYWGGYLIYRLYPRTKVVVDDRHDMYGAEFFKQYLKTVNAEPGWDEFLKEERVRVVLASAGSPLASLLQLAPGWQTMYQDESALLVQRREP
jgi:hypothetical protein